MMMIKKRIKIIFSFAFAVILGLAFKYAFQNSIQRASFAFFDTLQSWTAEEKVPGVALINLDDASLDAIKHIEKEKFPFPREMMGAVAVVAAKAGAKALAYDIIFSESSNRGVEDDQRFADLLKESNIPIYMPSATPKSSLKDTILDPIEIIKKNTTKLGRVDIEYESDGIIRRLIVNQKNNNDTLPQVIYSDLHPKIKQKIDASKYLKFYNTSDIPTISFYNVLRGYRSILEGSPLESEFEKLKGRVWFVGYSAASLKDLKSNPLDLKAGGTVILATALANLIQNNLIEDLSAESIFIVTLILIIFAVFLAIRFDRPMTVIFSVLGVALIVPVFTIIFWYNGIWFNPFATVLGILAAGGFELLFKFQSQWKDRFRFAKSLENSMSKDMLDLIRSGDVEISRFGETREITIFFCDLSGFTTFSEKMTPAELVELLNDYFDRVVNGIIGRKGYVDKFIGDAVMAFWNAPVHQSDHAALGVASALEYLQIVKKLNDELREKYPNLSSINGRVGIHTGTVVVGNIGAKHRHNYTAIGDSVNLASRLEGVGKVYHSYLTISEDSAKAAGILNHPGFFEVDTIAVKGRSIPTKIFSFFEPTEGDDVKYYYAGLKKYYLGLWSEARLEFRKADKIPASTTMIERCEKALRDGFLSQWKNGVWHLDEK